MKAGVVSSFGAAPRYEEFPAPIVADDHGMVVDVIAAGLHPRVRSQADGSHYTSTSELPLVPGLDGVGRGADGSLRYFVLPDTRAGAMAERAVIDTRRSVVLPAGSDPIAVAAAMNPAMSAWIALRQRVRFEAGQDVLVLGATGNAGSRQAAHLDPGRLRRRARRARPVRRAPRGPAADHRQRAGLGHDPRDLAELPALAGEITSGAFDIAARPVPLADVERAWAEAARTRQRIVITP